MRRILGWMGVVGISLLSLVGLGYIVVSYWSSWSENTNSIGGPYSKEVCDIGNCMTIYNNYSIPSCQSIHIIYPMGCIILGVSTIIGIGQLICIMIKRTYKYIDIIGSGLGCLGSILLLICLLIWSTSCKEQWLGPGAGLTLTYYTLVIITGLSFIQNILYILLRPYFNCRQLSRF